MAPVARGRLILRSPATPQMAGEARRRLVELGFEVAAEDPSGIAFQGAPERFEQVFGTPATAPLAVPGELAGVAADVVVPRSPELFP